MPEMNIEVRACRYHLTRLGEGSPLVLLHGFAGSIDTWQPISLELAKTHEVIAIDILGHGKTDATKQVQRYSMKEISLDLNELFRQLGLENFDLLGYSMGGRLALYFAYHYPKRVNRLLLESSSPGLKTEEERTERQAKDCVLAEQILSNGMDWFVRYWQTLPIFMVENCHQGTKQGLNNLHLLQKNAVPIGLANSLKGMGTGAQDSLWPVLKEISCKTALICGANDKKFCTINKEMQSMMPNAKQIIVASAGHRVHLENPSEFAAVVLHELNEKIGG